MSGWIKLHRKFLNWEWYTKDNMAHLFIHLILSANHRPTKWRGKTIERGQLLTGRRKLAESTGLTERSVRTCLNLLKSTNEIAVKTTSKFSIITVVNYEEYQKQDEETTSKTTIDKSGDRPSTDQVPTTSKNVKKYKNTKKRRSEECAREIPSLKDFLNYAYEVYGKTYHRNPSEITASATLKYQTWVDNNWHTGHGKEILNWKNTLRNTLPNLKREIKPEGKLSKQEQILKSIEDNELSRQTGAYPYQS